MTGGNVLGYHDDDTHDLNFHHDSDHEYHNMMTLRTVTMIRPQELGDC